MLRYLIYSSTFSTLRYVSGRWGFAPERVPQDVVSLTALGTPIQNHRKQKKHEDQQNNADYILCFCIVHIGIIHVQAPQKLQGLLTTTIPQMS